MTAASTAADQPFTVILDDDETSVAEGMLRRGDAGPTWAKHRVTLELDEGDTSGHALDATAVSISLHFDDDVEGHALSLRFPTAQKANDFRKRLLATGIVAGALVVGVTAAQLSGTVPATTSPIVAPAVPRTVSGPQLSSSHIQSKVGPAEPRTVSGPRLSSSHIQSEVAPAVPGSVSGPKLSSSHIQSKVARAAAPSTETPAQRHRSEHQ